MTSALKAQPTIDPSADVVPDPFGLEPGSSSPRESGFAPRRSFMEERSFAAEADERVQLAIAESAHAEANLNLLLRGLKNLAAGAASVSEANLELSRQLDAARELLAHGQAEQTALKRRVRMLEDALECARGDADRERAFFLQQEDAFLAELLSEHARELDELRRRLEIALANPTPRLEAPSRSTETTPEPSTETPRSTPIAVVRLRAKPPLKQKPAATTRPLIEYSLGGDQVVEESVAPSRSPSQPPDTLREPFSQVSPTSVVKPDAK
jgi:hypothetical protein